MSEAHGVVDADRHSGFTERHAAKMRWPAIGLVVLPPAILLREVPAERWGERLRGRIDGMGMSVSVVSGVACVIATMPFIPDSVPTFAAGARFGTVTAMVTVFIASTTGAAFPCASLAGRRHDSERMSFHE